MESDETQKSETYLQLDTLLAIPVDEEVVVNFPILSSSSHIGSFTSKGEDVCQLSYVSNGKTGVKV